MDDGNLCECEADVALGLDRAWEMLTDAFAGAAGRRIEGGATADREGASDERPD